MVEGGHSWLLKTVKQISESVRNVIDRQTCFESVLKLGPRPTEDQRIDLMPGVGWKGRSRHHSVQTKIWLLILELLNHMQSRRDRSNVLVNVGVSGGALSPRFIHCYYGCDDGWWV